MKERVIYLDYLRIMSITGVVVLHVAAAVLGDQSIFQTTKWYLTVGYDSLFRYCVPLFVMISGALLLIPEENPDIKKFFTKRFPRILVPFIIWSVIYKIFTSRGNIGSIPDAILGFIQGPVFYHLWFIYMLIGLYMIIPFIKGSMKNLRVAEYFLIIWFILGPCRNLVAFLFNVHLGVHLSDFPHGALGYAVLGYYLTQVKISQRNFFIAAGVFTGAYLINYFSLIYNTTGKNLPMFFQDYQQPSMVFITGGIFYMGRYIFSRSFFANKKAFPVITTLSDLTFGVYLCHALILEYIFNGTIFFQKSSWMPHPVGGITLAVLYCLILSFGLCYGLSRIKPLKNIFM
jgi:surface polysaccharide O-acyltransferase-like enzyme